MTTTRFTSPLMLDTRFGFVSAASAAPPTATAPPAPMPPTMIAAHATSGTVDDGRDAESGGHHDEADAAEQVTRATRRDTSGGEADERADQQRCGQDGAGDGLGDAEVVDHCDDHERDEVGGDVADDDDAEDGNTAAECQWDADGGGHVGILGWVNDNSVSRVAARVRRGSLSEWDSLSMRRARPVRKGSNELNSLMLSFGVARGSTSDTME